MPDAAGHLVGAAFSLALLWFVVGTLWRLRVWVATPSPLPIPLAPAPRGRWGVLGRLAAELLLFRSLARASLPTWLPAVLFHYGLLLVLIVHLRFLFPALPAWLLPFLLASGWATLALVLGLAALLARRALVDRVRRVSAPSDYLHVVLLLAIALTGAALKRLWPVELYRVGEFARGVLTLDWQPLPLHGGLLAHLAGVLLLLIVFPISKLVHAPGIAFAPTFHQRDPTARGVGSTIGRGRGDASNTLANGSGAAAERRRLAVAAEPREGREGESGSGRDDGIRGGIGDGAGGGGRSGARREGSAEDGGDAGSGETVRRGQGSGKGGR